jgi:hypothetical protein
MGDEQDDWLVGIGVSQDSFDNRGDDGGGSAGQDSGGDSGQAGGGQDLAQSGGVSSLGGGDGDSGDQDPVPLTQSAQSGDIEAALRAAKLWEKSDEVAQLMSQAGVPANVKVNIVITVDSALNVNFVVTTDPRHASGAKLSGLLKQKFSAAMNKAIKDKGLTVTDVVNVNWLNF